MERLSRARQLLRLSELDCPNSNTHSLPPSVSLSLSLSLSLCGRREGRSVLSFEDELADEGPEFKVKKTSLSRRLAKMAEREKKEKKGRRKREM